MKMTSKDYRMEINMSRNYRDDFPLIKNNDRIYIDNAATSQKPECVIKAEAEFYEKNNANPLRGFYPLSIAATKEYEDARETVRKFINAGSTKEIIFTRNTTEGINLVAYSYALNNLKAGDEIAVSIMEHHSNMLPWQMAARMTGAKLVYLDCEKDGTLSDETLAAGINEHTKIVAVGQVSNVLGCVNPVKKIAAMAHAAGAIMVVDAAQSAPHMKIDVKDMDADFLAFSGHKLMGPMGIGVLYGKQELLEKMEPFMTGGEMIDSVTREGAVYAQLPHKFEAGTVNAAGAAGLAAAIRYINEVGFDYIEEREKTLTRIAMEGLKEYEHIHVIGSENPDNHTGIVAFTIDNVHPHDVSEILSSDGIDVRAGHHCAQPLLTHLKVYTATRASFMFYNTEDEVRAFVKSAINVRRRMGYDE